jgi:hypothetical protein
MYTNLSVNKFDSYVEFFDYLAKSKKTSRLPQLALIILGFIMNNAGPKRLFSELAMIHTVTRNRLNPEKARKMTIIRKNARAKNAAEKSLVAAANSKEDNGVK